MKMYEDFNSNNFDSDDQNLIVNWLITFTNAHVHHSIVKIGSVLKTVNFFNFKNIFHYLFFIALTFLRGGIKKKPFSNENLHIK